MITKQILIASFLWLGELNVGFGMGWTSPMLPKLQDIAETPFDHVITQEQATWITSVIYIGAVLSPSILGNLPNVIGRKRSLQLGSAILLVSTLLMTIAKNFPMLIAYRFLFGFGTALVKICDIIYIGEMASTHIRGRLLSCCDVFPALGYLLVYSTGPFLPYIYTGYIALAMVTVYFIGLFFIPETPSFYIMKDQHEKAQETLKYLGREKDIIIIKSTNKEKEILEDQAAISRWKELFTVKANRKALFLTVSLMCFQQMGGVMIINFYALTIFELAGSAVQPEIASIVVSFVNVCSCTISPISVERLGRRTLLIFSTAATFVILAVLGSYFYLDFISNPFVDNIRLLPIICLALYYVCYCSGFNTIPGVLVGEMFSPRARSLGASIGYAVSLSFGFGVSTAFGYVIAITGGHVPFWFFSAVCACACLVAVLFVPETKGKTLQEIQDMLNK